MTTVVIVDDHPIVRAGMRTILNNTDDLTVVAEGARGADALRLVAKQRPDVLVLDVNLPDVNGIEVTRQLRALPSEVAVNLYRVTQEVLSNVARHAHARNVALQLAFEEARLALTIRDDGCGFIAPATLHELAAQGHFGLVGMHERVALIGGTCAVESTPGIGTTVQVMWQMANSQ